MKLSIILLLVAICLQFAVSSGYRHHYFRDDDEDEGPEESKTDGEILKDCSKKAMELVRRFYNKLKNNEVSKEKKKDVTKVMSDYLDETKAPSGPDVKLCEKLVLDLLKIVIGEDEKEPEATKPPTPEPTTPSVRDSIEKLFEEEDEEVKISSSISEQCKALAMKKFKEIEAKVKAFLAAKPTKEELSDHVYKAMKDAYKVKEDEVTMEKCFEHVEKVGEEYLMGLIKTIFAHLLGISKPTEAPTTAPDIEDYW